MPYIDEVLVVGLILDLCHAHGLFALVLWILTTAVIGALHAHSLIIRSTHDYS